MSMVRHIALAVWLLLLASFDAQSQEVFVMNVKGKVVMQKEGTDGRPLERGYRLPDRGNVEMGIGAVLQVMGPGGKLARIEGPCVRPVSALLDEVQKERSRPVARAFANLWEKFRNLWRDEGDLDSSGGTRGGRPYSSPVHASDRYRNPPETEIVLIAPRGGLVFADSVTLVWANGGALAPQRVNVLTDKLDTAFVAEVMRPGLAVPRARLSRPAGSLYIWSVSTPGCNPDESWFRCADQARTHAIREQVGQAIALAGGDPATLHILRAQIFEDGEFYADAFREFLAAAVADGTPATRALLEEYMIERLGLSRKVADEMHRTSMKMK